MSSVSSCHPNLGISAHSNMAITLVSQHGAGTNIWNVSKVMYRDFNKVGRLPNQTFNVGDVLKSNQIGATAGSLTYHTSTIFAKFSILIFYLRFSSANRAFRLTAYFVMIFTLSYTLPRSSLQPDRPPIP